MQLLSKKYWPKFTHLYIPSLCKEFIVMCNNLGHSNPNAAQHRCTLGKGIPIQSNKCEEEMHMAHSLTTMLASFLDGGDIASRKEKKHNGDKLFLNSIHSCWLEFTRGIIINDYSTSGTTLSRIFFQRKTVCFLFTTQLFLFF